MPSTLTIEQLKEGRLKALQNAESLIREASILLDNDYRARALFLSQVSGEELAKYVILTSALVEVALNPDSFNWRKFWRRYLSHKEKCRTILALEDLMLTEIDDFPAYLRNLPEIVSDLETGRQAALYSDYIDNHFFAPTDLFSAKMAEDAIRWARGRFGLLSEIERRYLIKIDGMTQKQLREGLTRSAEDLRRIAGDIALKQIGRSCDKT